MHRWLMDSPHKVSVMQKVYPCHSVFMNEEVIHTVFFVMTIIPSAKYCQSNLFFLIWTSLQNLLEVFPNSMFLVLSLILGLPAWFYISPWIKSTSHTLLWREMIHTRPNFSDQLFYVDVPIYPCCITIAGLANVLMEKSWFYICR